MKNIFKEKAGTKFSGGLGNRWGSTMKHNEERT